MKKEEDFEDTVMEVLMWMVLLPMGSIYIIIQCAVMYLTMKEFVSGKPISSEIHASTRQGRWQMVGKTMIYIPSSRKSSSYKTLGEDQVIIERLNGDIEIKNKNQ